MRNQQEQIHTVIQEQRIRQRALQVDTLVGRIFTPQTIKWMAHAWPGKPYSNFYIIRQTGAGYNNEKAAADA